MSMNVQTYDTTKSAVVAAAQHLLDHWKIDEAPIALFVSGGSSLDVFRELVCHLTTSEKARTSLYQVDERYGNPGHPDSNWASITEAGLTEFVATYPIITGNLDARQLATDYDRIVAGVESAKLAILGLGTDAHTAGIKPMPRDQYAHIFEGRLVAEYQWTDFHRITLTNQALMQFDGLYVYAAGVDKEFVVDGLSSVAPEYEQPIHGLQGHGMISTFYSKGNTA